MKHVNQKIMFAVEDAWKAFTDHAFRKRTMDETLYVDLLRTLLDLDASVQRQRNYEGSMEVEELRNRLSSLEAEKAALEQEIVNLLTPPGGI